MCVFFFQKHRGIVMVTRVEGKVYDNVLSAKGDKWKKRRSILTPAFSANKMKMVRNPTFVWKHVCVCVHVTFSGLRTLMDWQTTCAYL